MTRTPVYGGGAWSAAIVIAPLTISVGLAVYSLPEVSRGMSDAVAGELSRSGVVNPVTAVLLNFRGYDTLLEIAVLVAALLGVQSMIGAIEVEGSSDATPNPVLLSFVRIFAPVIVVVCGYLLWVGGHAPGGAFQAGAMLAGLGVLLSLCGIGLPSWYSGVLQRIVIVAGLATFIAVGLIVMMTHRSFLEYPVTQAKGLILLVEAACTVSIGAVLFALFASGAAEGRRWSWIKRKQL